MNRRPRSPSRSIRSALALALAGALALVVGCGAEPDTVTRRDCERLRDHLIELRMDTVTADVEHHRAALRAALGDAFVTGCTDTTTEQELRCALGAHTHDQLIACAVTE